jgi:S-adenosylmethionine-diacylglycerol 3-amino-3-carboxypropyl transferase
MPTDTIATRADFSRIRYAQCWEDAGVLVAGLDSAAGAHCVSISSAGDNTLALLTRAPARVVALDLNPAQLACLALRVAAYRRLQHSELLELIGSRPGSRRHDWYTACRPGLDEDARAFWDARPDLIAAGIGSAGKFERYFATFRARVLPCIHGRRTVMSLLENRDPDDRVKFYENTWNSWRWRLLFRIFFSRSMMGRMGRDPRFFDHVDGPVAARILDRTRHALAVLDPSDNPYLHWILTGTHGDALPLALREEHFETIRRHLDRLEWRLASIEELLDEEPSVRFDAWNLSDIFEYMPEQAYHQLLEKITTHSNPGARLAYWNMLAPRARPPAMASVLEPVDDLATRLHHEDRAFFYSRFVVEQVCR